MTNGVIISAWDIIRPPLESVLESEKLRRASTENCLLLLNYIECKDIYCLESLLYLAISTNIEKRLCEFFFCPFIPYSMYFTLTHEPY